MKTKVNYRHYRLPLVSDGNGTSLCYGKAECIIEFYDDNDILLSKLTGYAYCSTPDEYTESVLGEIAFNRAMSLYQYA